MQLLNIIQCALALGDIDTISVNSASTITVIHPKPSCQVIVIETADLHLFNAIHAYKYPSVVGGIDTISVKQCHTAETI